MAEVKKKEDRIFRQSRQIYFKKGAEVIKKFVFYLGLCNSCASLKDKFSMFIWILLRSSLYPLTSTDKNSKEKILYEKFSSIYKPIITVRNEDGLFKCRGWTDDIRIVNPITEYEIREYFSLREGVFIDVGAHIGKYTIMTGRKLVKGKIISIEADPDNFEILKENIVLNNLKNVIPLNLAAFRENGEIAFYKTISPHTSGYSIYSREHTKTINVKAMRLDEISDNLGLGKIDLIKIDVEGAEYDVLEGATRTLRKTKIVIYETIWGDKSEKCKDLLTKMGFEINRLGNNIIAINRLDDKNGKIKNTCNF